MSWTSRILGSLQSKWFVAESDEDLRAFFHGLGDKAIVHMAGETPESLHAEDYPVLVTATKPVREATSVFILKIEDILIRAAERDRLPRIERNQELILRAMLRLVESTNPEDKNLRRSLEESLGILQHGRRQGKDKA